MIRASEFPILKVIWHYHPEFEAPDWDDGWIKVLCPFHDDTNKSAGINYVMDSFSCLACGVKGNAFTIALQQEGSYAAAQRITKGLAPSGDGPVPPSPAQQPSRRVFGEPRSARPRDPGADRPVSPGIRGRTTPWT